MHLLYTYIHSFIHTYTHKLIHSYICCIHIFICSYIHTCTHTHTLIHVLYTYIHTLHRCIHAYITQVLGQHNHAAQEYSQALSLQPSDASTLRGLASLVNKVSDMFTLHSLGVGTRHCMCACVMCSQLARECGTGNHLSVCMSVCGCNYKSNRKCMKYQQLFSNPLQHVFVIRRWEPNLIAFVIGGQEPKLIVHVCMHTYTRTHSYCICDVCYISTCTHRRIYMYTVIQYA